MIYLPTPRMYLLTLFAIRYGLIPRNGNSSIRYFLKRMAYPRRIVRYERHEIESRISANVIRILIVEDHAFVYESLHALIEHPVILQREKRERQQAARLLMFRRLKHRWDLFKTECFTDGDDGHESTDIGELIFHNLSGRRLGCGSLFAVQEHDGDCRRRGRL